MQLVETEALALVAQALDHDRGGGGQGGDAWLESRLGDAVAGDVLTPMDADGARALGRRIYRRLQREVFSLLCGSDPEDDADRRALGIEGATVASAVAAALTAGLGVGPQAAAIAAALILRRIARPSLQEVCARWREHLGDQTPSTAETP